MWWRWGGGFQKPRRNSQTERSNGVRNLCKSSESSMTASTVVAMEIHLPRCRASTTTLLGKREEKTRFKSPNISHSKCISAIMFYRHFKNIAWVRFRDGNPATDSLISAAGTWRFPCTSICNFRWSGANFCVLRLNRKSFL